MNSIFAKVMLAAPLSISEDYALYRNKKDKVFRRLLEESKLYIIGQRYSLYFKNISLSSTTLDGVISQDSTDLEVIFSLDLIQENVLSAPLQDCKIAISNNSGVADVTEFSGTYKPDDDKDRAVDCITVHDAGGNFLITFTPDILIWRYYRRHWEFNVLGESWSDLLTFNVLYIGEAAKRKGGVIERIKGHEKLEEIILVHKSLNEKVAVKKEIVIAVFEISKVTSMVPPLKLTSSGLYIENSADYVELPTVFLDVEKALIKVFDTSEYNIKQYNKYPISTDGLAMHDYQFYVYCIDDPIEVIDNKKTQLAGINKHNGNYIFVDRINHSVSIENKNIDKIREVLK